MTPIQPSCKTMARGALAAPLRLDRNEGPAPGAWAVEALAGAAAESIRRYPEAAALEAELAARIGVAPERVLVTAGGDDGIERVCRVALAGGADAVLHAPTFEVIEWAARRAARRVRRVAWMGGDFPEAPFAVAIGPGVGLVALVTPNNPTGEAIPGECVGRVAARSASVGGVTLVDLAYVEFAECDPTRALVSLPGVVVLRTFSKAYGLAGLRIGWLVGDAGVIARAREAGGPFPTSGPGLVVARAALGQPASWLAGRVARVERERDAIAGALGALGVTTADSRANFVCAVTADAAGVADRLRGAGVQVRTWPGDEARRGLVRITCPGDEDDLRRLLAALPAGFGTGGAAP